MNDVISIILCAPFPPHWKQYCHICHQECCIDDLCLEHGNSNASVCVVAGHSCTDYSARGLRLFHCGDTIVTLAVFIVERLHRREDFGITECTPAFAWKFVFDHLSDIYLVWSLTMTPSLLGVPEERPRRFCFFLRKDKWMPLLNFSLRPTQYFRKCVLTFAVYFDSEEEALAEEWTDFGRSLSLPPAIALARQPLLLLNGNHHRILSSHVTALTKASQELSGLVDVSQNPKFSKLSSGRVSGHATQTCSVSLDHSRPMVRQEYCWLRGISVNRPAMNRFRNPLQSAFFMDSDRCRHSRAAIIRKTGNGMHVKVFITLFLHFFGNIERIQDEL